LTERIDICNQALSWLGESPITSIDDETTRAHQCKINYAPTRDAVLEAHDWTFAIERFIPAQNVVPPVYGPGIAYDIPPQIIRVIACDNPNNSYDYPFVSKINGREQIDWQLEGDKIICSEAVIHCRGVRRIEEEGRFSPLFVQAFAAKLAFLLAQVVTSDPDIAQNVYAMYDLFIKEAVSRDGIQGRSRQIVNRQLAKSR
jgi:hypothetical protein